MSKLKETRPLKQYKKDVDTVYDKEIEQIFKRCFVDLRKNTCSSMPIKQRTKAQYCICTARNVFVLFMILAIFIYILLNVHQPTTSFVLRNVQYLTYPTLKIIRYLSVPIIKIFPSLTDLYDETCLVEIHIFTWQTWNAGLVKMFSQCWI
ncbi:hypothetical protein NQ317_016881 [Molorchus minor]|uniref:Odorant receptor n=1 Tax=Molorchus minor TaxID=1323400 RepID=A0ABQ9J884_9CUCU|nr:hypothetical protein NQ317_016881 [Molorchus minor]